MPTIGAIHRYPVKGLAAERLPRVALTIGATLPADRLYAIENGRSGFDPAAPSYLPKQRFLMLMRNARLAELTTSLDETTHTLTVTAAGEIAAVGGPVENGRTSGTLDWAIYFSRYLGSMPPLPLGSTRSLPGNNACYKREALDAVAEIFAEDQSQAGDKDGDNRDRSGRRPCEFVS